MQLIRYQESYWWGYMSMHISNEGNPSMFACFCFCFPGAQKKYQDPVIPLQRDAETEFIPTDDIKNSSENFLPKPSFHVVMDTVSAAVLTSFQEEEKELDQQPKHPFIVSSELSTAYDSLSLNKNLPPNFAILTIAPQIEASAKAEIGFSKTLSATSSCEATPRLASSPNRKFGSGKELPSLSKVECMSPHSCPRSPATSLPSTPKYNKISMPPLLKLADLHILNGHSREDSADMPSSPRKFHHERTSSAPWTLS